MSAETDSPVVDEQTFHYSVNVQRLLLLRTPITAAQLEALHFGSEEDAEAWEETLAEAEMLGYVRFYHRKGVWSLTELGEEYIEAWS